MMASSLLGSVTVYRVNAGRRAVYRYCNTAWSSSRVRNKRPLDVQKSGAGRQGRGGTRRAAEPPGQGWPGFGRKGSQARRPPLACQVIALVAAKKESEPSSGCVGQNTLRRSLFDDHAVIHEDDAVGN